MAPVAVRLLLDTGVSVCRYCAQHRYEHSRVGVFKFLLSVLLALRTEMAGSHDSLYLISCNFHAVFHEASISHVLRQGTRAAGSLQLAIVFFCPHGCEGS